MRTAKLKAEQEAKIRVEARAKARSYIALMHPYLMTADKDLFARTVEGYIDMIRHVRGE